MKTAISIPDEDFRSGERLRKRLRLSRSELYARAIRDLVSRYREHPVTRKLNEVYGPDGEGSELDPALERAALKALRRSEWK
jgi:hypothetical protein